MSLNLSKKNIEDEDNIFNEINNPEKYTSIDLSHNLLTTLPKDLSLFSNLRTLNITNNKFINYQEVAASLSTLPELQDLSIDLSNQENVIIILSTLPNLIKLNGQSTADTTLQQSFLSQSNLTTIFPNNLNNNINNNSIINLNNNNNSEYKPNETNGNTYNEKGDISLNEETGIFEYIYKQLNNEVFNKKLQLKLREEITNINKNLDISNNLYNAIIVKSKLEIYTFILEEVLNIITDDNNKKSSFDIIKKIINIVKDKLKENQNILFELVINNNSNKNKKDNKNASFNDKLENKSFLNNKEKIIDKKDLICLLNEIYQYNKKQNEKTIKLSLPKESLFDSINPYLTTKYGLKSIASFWNNKIMEGINYYYKTDSEINLFKNIFEGKIKENFYSKYIELKSSCSSIIYKWLKEKYPQKLNIEIDNLLDDKINNYLTYDEWTKIINNILRYNNKNEIINQIIGFINKKNKVDKRYQKMNELDKKELKILFNDFIICLIDMQIID